MYVSKFMESSQEFARPVSDNLYFYSNLPPFIGP